MAHCKHKFHPLHEENFRNIPALAGTELSPSSIHSTVEKTPGVNAKMLLWIGSVKPRREAQRGGNCKRNFYLFLFPAV